MTREEAKGSLIAIKNKYLANYGEDSIINILIDEYDIQAIDMAIQALEQEPCEDAISRQAVIDTISELNAISFYEAQEDSKECYYEIRQAIKDLSPINPQERTGHWNLFHTTEHGMREDSYFKCNRCNYESYKEYNFCPDCGARMEVEK